MYSPTWKQKSKFVAWTFLKDIKTEGPKAHYLCPVSRILIDGSTVQVGVSTSVVDIDCNPVEVKELLDLWGTDTEYGGGTQNRQQHESKSDPKIAYAFKDLKLDYLQWIYWSVSPKLNTPMQ